ncbi:MAG: hypothetical protein AB7F96_16510 [Beijerinckiaceae bacterium]
MAWPGDDPDDRPRVTSFQGVPLKQYPRPGGGYAVDVQLRGGFILKEIPLAAGNVFVGGGPNKTVWLTQRETDRNKIEAYRIAGDPKKEYTPTEPEGFIQNPDNPKQRMRINGKSANIDTDGKDTKVNDTITMTAKGDVKAKGDMQAGGKVESPNAKHGTVIADKIQLAGKWLSGGGDSGGGVLDQLEAQIKSADDLLAKLKADLEKAKQDISSTSEGLLAEAAQAREEAGALSTRVFAVEETTGENTAAITQEIFNRTTQAGALSGRLDTVETVSGENTAAITEEVLTRAEQTGALADRLDTVESTTTSNTAAITNEIVTRTNERDAAALRFEAVEAVAGGNTAAITNEILARTDGDTALAGEIIDVEAKADQALATYTVQVNANGRIAGLNIIADATLGATPVTAFTILADIFAIYQEGYGEQPVFSITTVNGVPALTFAGNLLGDAAVSERVIAQGAASNVIYDDGTSPLQVMADATETATGCAASLTGLAEHKQLVQFNGQWTGFITHPNGGSLNRAFLDVLLYRRIDAGAWTLLKTVRVPCSSVEPSTITYGFGGGGNGSNDGTGTYPGGFSSTKLSIASQNIVLVHMDDGPEGAVEYEVRTALYSQTQAGPSDPWVDFNTAAYGYFRESSILITTLKR